MDNDFESIMSPIERDLLDSIIDDTEDAIDDVMSGESIKDGEMIDTVAVSGAEDIDDDGDVDEDDEVLDDLINAAADDEEEPCDDDQLCEGVDAFTVDSILEGVLEDNE